MTLTHRGLILLANNRRPALPLFASAEQAVEHGLAEIEYPRERARRTIAMISRASLICWTSACGTGPTGVRRAWISSAVDGHAAWSAQREALNLRELLVSAGFGG